MKLYLILVRYKLNRFRPPCIISDTPGQKAGAKREFSSEGLVLNFVSGHRDLGAYLGPQAELEAWVKHQVKAWAHGVRVLAKIDRRHPQSSYAGLGMSLQSEWQYLQGLSPQMAGAYLGPQAELEAWVKHQVKSWAHGVRVLAKIDRRHP